MLFQNPYFTCFLASRESESIKSVSLFTANAYPIIHKSPIVPIAHIGWRERKNKECDLQRELNKIMLMIGVTKKNTNEMTQTQKGKKKERVHKMGVS